MSRKKAIGIDLGTSKCCVGIFRDGKVEILANEPGNKTTPSYVAFTDTERLVGEKARDQATHNPANTVFGVKRIIGREVEDGLLGEAVNKMPYTIMNKNEVETFIHVSYKDAEEFLLPQQITAMLLGKMKDLAELHLKRRVEEAVISVPASFSNAQRQATKDAGAIAGLKVLALINEPTAAAIAYEANRRETSEENIAVVDFGAGNLNVAIVTVRRGRVSVRAVSGSTAIGGNDIDEVLMKYVGSKFEDKFRQKLPESPAMTERLRSCCEILKRKLSLLPKVQETLDCFGDDNVLPITINREDFKAVMPEVVQSTLNNCLRRTIQASAILQKNISRVVLVGGSSRIPLFQTWLEDFFGPKSLDKSVNPDEAVAYGATLYAALLSGDNELDEFAVEDRVPNDYCFFSNGDSNMQHVFEQHSRKTLPQRRVFLFNGQSPFNEKTRTHTFELYEQLSGQKNPHRLIGTLCLEDEFRQAVSLIADVTIGIDRCGIFNAVVQLRPNHVFPEVVKNYAGKLCKDKLRLAVEREQQFRRDDRDERERVEAMSSLEALSLHLQSAMDDEKVMDLFPDLAKQIIDKVEETLQWLDATKTVPKMECVKREKTVKQMDNNLKLQLQEHEEKERERVAVVNELNDYLVKLEAITSGPDVSEEREQAAELERQVVQTRHWLQSTKTPSKQECMEKCEFLDGMHNILKNKLEARRKETERITAVSNLRAYCNSVEDSLKSDSNDEDNRDLTDRVLSQARANLSWLDKASYTSAAECEAKKSSLKESHAEIIQNVSRKAEKRTTAVRQLRSYCNALLSSVVTSKKYRDVDLDCVKHLESEARETIRWLDDGRTTSKESCDDRLFDLETLEATLKSLVENQKQNEASRIDARQKFGKYFAGLRVSLPMLNKATNKDDQLLLEITEQTQAISLCLKNCHSFSNDDYEVKLQAFRCLIETLRNRAEEENLKDLNDKANGQLDAFKSNKAYNLRLRSNANASSGAGNVGHEGHANGTSRQVEKKLREDRPAGTGVQQDEDEADCKNKRSWLKRTFLGNN